MALGEAGSMERLDAELTAQEAEAVIQSAEGNGAASQSQTSWTTLLRVLYDSLKRSAVHVENMTLGTLALGMLPLVKLHEAEELDPGQPVMDAELMSHLLKYGRWADAAYNCIALPALAAELNIPLAGVIYLEQKPEKTAHLPTYYVAIEHDIKRINLVVRGTQAMRDIVSDLCGHTVPFLDGHVHFGVMQAAQALLNKELFRLQDLVSQFTGYGVHIVGHSLGAGVAALLACMLSMVPAHQEQLQGVHVTATTFASPPVMTAELAERCTFITSVINAHDMVPRISVSSLAQLSRDLIREKTQVLGNSELAVFLNKSGALTAGSSLAAAMMKHYAVVKPVAFLAGHVAKAPSRRMAVSVGLQLLGSAASTMFASPAASAPLPASPAPSTTLSAGSAVQRAVSAFTGTTTGPAAVLPAPAAAPSLWGMAASSAFTSMTTAASGAASPAATSAAAPPAPVASSRWGLAAVGAFKAISTRMATEVADMKAAAASHATTTSVAPSTSGALSLDMPSQPSAGQRSAEAVSGSAASGSTASAGAGTWWSGEKAQSLRLLGGQALNRLDEKRKGTASGGLRPADGPQEEDGLLSAAGVGTVDTALTTEQDQQLHPLVVAGVLLYMARAPEPVPTPGAAAAKAAPGPRIAASYQLMRDVPAEAFQRLLLKRSMMRDHSMTSYLTGLAACETALAEAQVWQFQGAQPEGM